MAKLKELVQKEKPHSIISVGDVVSKNLHQYNIHPQITIIDNVSLRIQSTAPPEAHGEETVRVKNPQGTITEEANSSHPRSLSQRRAHSHRSRWRGRFAYFNSCFVCTSQTLLLFMVSHIQAL